MTISASQLRLSNNLENDGSGGLRVASALAAFGLLRTGAFALAVDSANLVGAGMEVDGGGLFQIAASAAGNGLAGGGGGALTVDQDYAFNFTGFHGTLDANLNASGNTVTGLGAPSNASDAATKSYVDGLVSGLDVKASVFVASDENITLSGGQTIDGMVVAGVKRVLVMGQTDASENGIYDSAAGAWSRSSDFDDATSVTSGAFTFVEAGTKYADTGWVLGNDGPITVDTTDLVFTQFSSAGLVDAGAGMTKTGNQINVIAADASLSVGANDVSVARDAAGAIGLSGTGIKLNVSVDSMAIAGNNLGLKIDGSGGLQALNGGNGVGIKVDAGGALSLSADGLDLTLGINKGLEVVDNSLSIKVDGTKGAALSAAGLSVKFDDSTIKVDGGGQLYVPNNGIGSSQLNAGAVTPVKLSFTRTREDYADTGWTYANSVNSRTVGATPLSSTQVIQDQVFMRNGVETGFKRVSGAPAAEGEWRLNGTTLEVYSAATFAASGDGFTAKYHA